MTFAEKLRHIRTGQHKTQTEVAKYLGVSNRTIILYEQGSRKPRSEEIYQKLAELFDAPVEFWQTEKESDFQITSMYAHGNAGRVQADKLVSEMAGLFAGGKLSEEDADEVMLALQKAYWQVKEKHIDKRLEEQD